MVLRSMINTSVNIISLDSTIDPLSDGTDLSNKIRSLKTNPTKESTLSKNRRMTKVSPDPRNLQPVPANVVKIGNRQYKRIELIPRNTAQETLIEYLNDDSKRIVFSVGPAGTGKSYLSILKAIQMLRSGEVSKLVIVRPAVGAEGESHGYLPGSLTEKLGPWLQPLVDIFEEFYGKQGFLDMVEDGTVEFGALMYMRGRSFKDTVVVLDESQNCLPSQVKLLLTRLGENTRAFVTGDLDQTDHRCENGLADFVNRLKTTGSDMIGVAEFERKHIERDPIVAEVLRIYGDKE